MVTMDADIAAVFAIHLFTTGATTEKPRWGWTVRFDLFATIRRF